MSRFQRIGELMAERGPELITSLLVLIVGLLLARWIVRILRNALLKVTDRVTLVSIICNTLLVLLLAVVVVSASLEAGLQPGPVISFLTFVCLAAVGVIILFRPLLPTLPFKVGNVVKAADLLGRIEATTILNTRLKTFDGKTFFVPNCKILDDIVINYHFTQTRRIKIDVNLRYDQDLMKAKRLLEEIMIADPRVKAKPAPVVYVLNLSRDCVELGGRCWVDNPKYWVTRCDILEKTKLGFDNAGLAFAFRQLDVHHHNPPHEPEPDFEDA